MVLSIGGLLERGFYNLRPTAGIEANADSGYWVYGGARYDYSLSRITGTDSTCCGQLV